jgi:hypothetical protein
VGVGIPEDAIEILFENVVGFGQLADGLTAIADQVGYP